MDDAVHDDVDDDRLKDMIHDVGVESFVEAHGYGSMSSDAETPLYPGSTNFTWLSVVLRLMNLKAINGWTSNEGYVVSSHHSNDEAFVCKSK